jgi:hypothetical protein
MQTIIRSKNVLIDGCFKAADIVIQVNYFKKGVKLKPKN